MFMRGLTLTLSSVAARQWWFAWQYRVRAALHRLRLCQARRLAQR